ncbi:hypothetical protein [Hansschlegelia zhihuaiae]|uniref:ParB/Sulfiredoxin domain-containing protein n=1 Tax=Hansschlegelia zhihuaiae TaxID=405005 RepID=A0A4Q0MJJ2_9HYPH|nr:hypothetical protein [Hansschlegelia zhihuaiae]RXF73734.1 hypothetical protein EK403_09110 [Hansschlegelia zhihuaiae]
MNDAPDPTLFAPALGGLELRARLLGQPHLEDYITFVQTRTVGGERADVRALADEWREANDHYYELERTEAGIADDIERLDVEPELAPLIAELQAQPRFSPAHDPLPSRFELVEAHRPVVSQQSVSLNFVETLKSGLGLAPSPERLFRFCQPIEPPQAPVRAQRLDDNHFLFSSDSSDFRAHDATLLRPAQILELAAADPMSAIVAVPVGFGSNVLHAIETDDRLILQNGYHRAYALRDLGITHAYCAVQTVTRRDELKLVAGEPVIEAPEFYCRAKRPPLLKDFFDPKIRKVLNVRRMSRMIEVKLEVREYQVVE